MTSLFKNGDSSPAPSSDATSQEGNFNVFQCFSTFADLKLASKNTY